MTSNDKDRKHSHLQIALEQEVYLDKDPFSKIQLSYNALPELNVQQIDLSTTFLGKKFPSPLLISSMTGGSFETLEINEKLAILAQTFNLPLALGSFKIALKNEDTLQYFDMKKKYPDLFLIGNIGANFHQLGFLEDKVFSLCEKLKYDALYLHVNPLQEALQPMGEAYFEKTINHLEKLVQKAPLPLIVKEVGHGFSLENLKALQQCGIQGIDTSGIGGTSWARIEGVRAQNSLGELFQDWGYSSYEMLTFLKEIKYQESIVASGGISNPLQAAKALSMGAHMVGMASPFLKLIQKPLSEQEKWVQEFLLGLTIAFFGSGSSNWKQLQNKTYLK